MKVLIMGCGRVGAELTIQLAKAGHEVSIIDKRREAFERLPPEFEAKTFVGIGFDREDLEEAGIKDADAFIPCTRSGSPPVTFALHWNAAARTAKLRLPSRRSR